MTTTYSRMFQKRYTTAAATLASVTLESGEFMLDLTTGHLYCPVTGASSFDNEKPFRRDGMLAAPSAVADNEIPRWNGTDGYTTQSSGITIADASAGTLAPTGSKTLGWTASVTLAGTDGKTLTINDTAAISGTNTGDQTITLTGDVTGSGTGSFAATIANDAVTYAKMQNVSATDKVLGRSTAGAGDVEEITCTSFGRSLIDDADASAARTTLGLVIGTNVQAYDAELAAIAGLTSAADSFPYFTGSGTAALLVIGSAVRTFLATPSSANLASALTDETGSGKVVFSTAPTFDSTITVGTAAGTTGAVLLNGTTSGTVTFKVADAAGTHTIKVPTADGSANQVLKTDGSGQWGWVGISQTKVRQISVVFDGQGSALTASTKAYLSCPFAGTITKARILADQSGSCVVDIWKDTYANYPPTIADTITASAKPTLSSAQKNEDSTLTGWTTSVSAGDTFVFNVDSATTVTRVTVTLEITTTT